MPRSWLDRFWPAKQAADFAPGLPRRDRLGELARLAPGDLVTYVAQQHDAARAGPHTDLRFGTPATGLYSWAVRRGVPVPGETALAVRQPVHRHRYARFEGVIPAGQYGAGRVRTKDRGEALVTHVSPRHVALTLAHRKHPERLTLTRPGGGTAPGQGREDWLLRNATPTAPLPYQKVRHTSHPHTAAESVLAGLPPEAAVQPKVDGASALVQLGRRGPELFSYRTATETGRPIVHTERMFLGKNPEQPIPAKLVGSVLRGELYGAGPGGRVIPPQELGGILNATVAGALRQQQARQIALRTMLFDIQQHGRRPIDLHATPYAERRRLLESVLPHLPADRFHLAPQVHGPEAAQRLWDAVRSGTHPLTREGVVIHRPRGRPEKIKLTGEHDVVLTGTFPGQGRRRRTVGGLTYAHPEAPGRTVGRVGSGLSEATLHAIARDPAAFLGRTARLRAQERLPSGALRAPVFLALHEDVPAREVRRNG